MTGRTTEKKAAPDLAEKNGAAAEDIFAQIVARPKRRGEFHLVYDPADHDRFTEARSRAAQLKMKTEWQI